MEKVLRRDRLIILLALAGLAGLSWIYLVRIAASGSMAGGDSHVAMAALAPNLGAWSAAQAIAMLAMWAIMMVGMMIPSAAPMILIYARVGHQAQSQGRAFAPAGWFAAGYLLVWLGFSCAATALHWALGRMLLLTPMMAAASDQIAGLLLIVAGLYQWSPIKEACLRLCQSPFQFIQRHGGFRGTARGALTLGLRHGTYCVGCCWGLMLLLFVGGVMNLLWIAGIAALVLIEKVSRWGRAISRVAGVVMACAGLVLAGQL